MPLGLSGLIVDVLSFGWGGVPESAGLRGRKDELLVEAAVRNRATVAGRLLEGALPLLVLIGLGLGLVDSPAWGLYVGLIVAGFFVLRAATAGLKISGDRLIYRGVYWTRSMNVWSIRAIELSNDVRPLLYFRFGGGAGLRIRRNGGHDIDCSVVYGRSAPDVVMEMQRLLREAKALHRDAERRSQ